MKDVVDERAVWYIYPQTTAGSADKDHEHSFGGVILFMPRKAHHSIGKIALVNIRVGRATAYQNYCIGSPAANVIVLFCH